PLAFSFFHCGLGELVVETRGAPLADPAPFQFFDHLVDRIGLRFYRRRARHIPDGPEPYSPADDLPSGRVDERGERLQPTVAEQALPFVGVVDARHLDAFVAD